jgi:hypothetical protein
VFGLLQGTLAEAFRRDNNPLVDAGVLALTPKAFDVIYRDLSRPVTALNSDCGFMVTACDSY